MRRAVAMRFDEARARKAHAAEGTAAGRAYVDAYVEYIHFVEAIHRLTEDGAAHQHHEEAPHFVP